MYKRRSNANQTIEWHPENKRMAAKAIVNTEKTGADSVDEVMENTKIDLGSNSNDLAEKIRSEYQRLLARKESVGEK